MKATQKLYQLVQRELLELESNVILKTGDSYQAFGKYLITPEKYSCTVSFNDDFVGRFANTRTAISYCIADNQNYLNLARKIQNLDERLQHLQLSLDVRKLVSNQTQNSNLKELTMIKIQHRKAREKSILAELEKCIKLAKYLHHKGFSNETERTGRTASYKIYN